MNKYLLVGVLDTNFIQSPPLDIPIRGTIITGSDLCQSIAFSWHLWRNTQRASPAF